MSAPPTGVPAQGGVAPTDIEEAKREVVALKAREERLAKQIGVLNRYRSSRSTEEERTETGKQLWREFEIGVRTVDDAEVTLAELEKDLLSVNEQLAEAMKHQSLVMERAEAPQGTKRGREEAGLGRSGDIPDRKRAAHGPSTGRVSSRSPEPVAAAHAWKVDLCLPRGLAYRGLRRKLYEFAGQRLAFDADMQYVPVDGQYTLDSDLRFTAYTKKDDEAGHLQRDILDYCAKRVGNTFTYPRGVMPECVEHTVCQPVYAFHYNDAERSPDVAGREEEPSEPCPPSLTDVPEDRARNEFVIGAEAAYRFRFTPEACRLLEKHDYSKTPYPLIESDYANRIILEPNLHYMFDEKPPTITFFCETPSADLFEYSDLMRDLTLVARFSNATTAKAWSGFLRASTLRGDYEVTFTIKHPRPRAFVRYLHLRHALNCKAMGLEHKIQDNDFISHFDSLKSMTVSDLKAEGKDLGVEGCSKMHRDELLDAVLHATIHSEPRRADKFSPQGTSDS